MNAPPLSSLSTRDLVVAALLLFAFSACVALFLLEPRNRLDGRHSAPLPIQSLGNRPILQLELARSETDIVAILGEGDRTRKYRRRPRRQRNSAAA